MTPRQVDSSGNYIGYKDAPAKGLEKPDCSKTCRNYEPVGSLTQAEVDRIFASLVSKLKYKVGEEVWNLEANEAVHFTYISPDGHCTFETLSGALAYSGGQIEVDYHFSPLPAKPPIDWHVGDWAMWTSVSITSLPTPVLLNLTNSHIGNSWLVDQLSIPTPEQLLVEYKGHKCLAWEYDEDRTIKVQFGDNFSHLYHSKHRFLIPDCLAVVSYDQMKRHYPNGIEYPKGE